MDDSQQAPSRGIEKDGRPFFRVIIHLVRVAVNQHLTTNVLLSRYLGNSFVIVLALETSSRGGSIAILQGTAVQHSLELPPEQRSAQSLPMFIDRLLKEQSLPAREIELIAVTAGPGSFTGLRVGVMTAKTLAFAWGCGLLGVNTLEVIARESGEHFSHGEPRRIRAVLDAQRQQLFASDWEHSAAGVWSSARGVEIVERETWLKSLVAGDVVTGPGLTPLVGQLPAEVTISPWELWQPTAGMVGRVAVEHWELGARSDWRTLVPNYHRQSAAEEKRASLVKEK